MIDYSGLLWVAVVVAGFVGGGMLLWARATRKEENPFPATEGGTRWGGKGSSKTVEGEG